MVTISNPYEGPHLPQASQGGLGAIIQQLEAFKLGQALGVAGTMKLFGGQGQRQGPDFMPGWNPPIELFGNLEAPTMPARTGPSNWMPGWNPPIDLFGNVDINIPRGEMAPLPDTIFGQRAGQYLSAKDAARRRLTGGQAAEVAARANAPLNFEPGPLSDFFQDIAQEELQRRGGFRESKSPESIPQGDILSYLSGLNLEPGPMAGSYQDVASEELARRAAAREALTGGQARDVQRRADAFHAWTAANRQSRDVRDAADVEAGMYEGLGKLPQFAPTAKPAPGVGAPGLRPSERLGTGVTPSVADAANIEAGMLGFDMPTIDAVAAKGAPETKREIAATSAVQNVLKDALGSKDDTDVPAWALPLAVMGFTMAASSSPHFAQAVGQGGLAGLQVAQSEKKARTATKMAKAELALKGISTGADVTRAEAATKTAEASMLAAKAALVKAANDRPEAVQKFEYLVRLGVPPKEALDRTMQEHPDANMDVLGKAIASRLQIPGVAWTTKDTEDLFSVLKDAKLQQGGGKPSVERTGTNRFKLAP